MIEKIEIQKAGFCLLLRNWRDGQGESVQIVRQAAAALGLEVVDLAADLRPGATWPKIVQERAAQARVCVAIVGVDLSPDFYYQLGILAASGKPLVAVVPDGSILPSSIGGSMLQVGPILSDESVQRALRRSLNFPAPVWPVLRSGRPLGSVTDDLLTRFQNLEMTEATELDYCKLFEELLVASGVGWNGDVRLPQFDAGRGARRYQVDYVVTLDELMSTLGSPLPVELFAAKDLQRTLARRAEAFERYMDGTGAVLLLAVTIKVDQDAEPVLFPLDDRSVLVIPMRQMIEGLRDRTFAEVVTGQYNNTVRAAPGA